MIIANFLYGLTSIMNQPNNFNLCNEIETCQYNTVLAITCAITVSLKEKLYQSLVEFAKVVKKTMHFL